MPNPASSPCLLRAQRRHPKTGYEPITPGGRGVFATGIDFGILRLARGQTWSSRSAQETFCLLMRGRARGAGSGLEARLDRGSVFDEGPSSIHGGPGRPFEIRAESACEWLVARTANARSFETRIYRKGDCANEDRGAGLAQGACRRLVRTILDYSTRPESNLVCGEVVNYPGRWSTYPPHHHPQPEIYHYRFTLPQGYGHAELGDDVFKVFSGDSLLIPGGLDHSQVSAPGYGMYYFWVIRHLPRPYRGFTFTPAHRWLLDPKRQGWTPPL